MFSLPVRWLLLPAGLSLAAPLVQAQVDPPGALAPPLQFRSALAQYRKFDAQPVASWGELNATVSTIGGWRSYAREARQPETTMGYVAPTPAAKAAATGSAKPVPESHMGHGVKP